MARPGPRRPRRDFGYTADEYLGLAEAGVLPEDDHMELLEGVLVAGEPRNPPHASAVSRVHGVTSSAPCWSWAGASGWSPSRT